MNGSSTDKLVRSKWLEIQLALSFNAVLATGSLILEGRVVQTQKQKIHAQEK